MIPDEAITVLLLTSPLPSHPSTAILDETLASVRHWLPTADVLLLCDGVRPEQEDRREAYTEAIRRHLHDCALNWERVTPLLFAEHRHQSGMLRSALAQIRTPLTMFVEGDCPVVTDELVEWDGICECILSGDLHLVRLHHEAHLHLAEHGHLYLEHEPVEMHGVPMVRTAQFSARPFVASTAWLRETVARYFAEDARTMIEDVLHGVADYAWRTEGFMGWAASWRMAVYHPLGGNIKRSWTLDGRGPDIPKYEESWVFAYDGPTPPGAPRATSERV